MGAVGRTEWIKDEALMDAITALSGSGPAYVFLFLEALANAGLAAGLSSKEARKLSIETVFGSAAMAAQSSESFEKLRQNVTSPGGFHRGSAQSADAGQCHGKTDKRGRFCRDAALS